MAPTDTYTFQWQTSEIINCLLEDEEDSDACVETDGPDSFDPGPIADKLRKVGDSMNDDKTFKAVLKNLKKATAQEATEAAFSHGVEALCQTQAAQRSDLAPELQLIGASMALGLYVKKSCPELLKKVKSAMMAFLSRRVGPWVDQQGGWDKVSGVSV